MLVLREILEVHKNRGKTMHGHKEKAEICKPRTEASEETKPTNSWSWTSNLQNCEKINFCCLSHLVYDTLCGSSSKLIQYVSWRKKEKKWAVLSKCSLSYCFTVAENQMLDPLNWNFSHFVSLSIKFLKCHCGE